MVKVYNETNDNRYGGVYCVKRIHKHVRTVETVKEGFAAAARSLIRGRIDSTTGFEA